MPARVARVERGMCAINEPPRCIELLAQLGAPWRAAAAAARVCAAASAVLVAAACVVERQQLWLASVLRRMQQLWSLHARQRCGAPASLLDARQLPPLRMSRSAVVLCPLLCWRLLLVGPSPGGDDEVLCCCGRARVCRPPAVPPGLTEA